MIETASQLPLPWCNSCFARHSGSAKSVASQYLMSNGGGSVLETEPQAEQCLFHVLNYVLQGNNGLVVQ